MVATLLTGTEKHRAFVKLLQPERLADGTEPERRVILCGVSWPRYLALDKALGDDRPGPRFCYLDGELEIIATSDGHERIKAWIASLMGIFSRNWESKSSRAGRRRCGWRSSKRERNRMSHGASAMRKNFPTSCSKLRSRAAAFGSWKSTADSRCRRFGFGGATNYTASHHNL